MLFLTISLLTALVWLQDLVVLLLGILKFLQIITGVSEVFMALTILGIGNSVPDFFVDSQLAREGFEIMAMAGLIGG